MATTDVLPISSLVMKKVINVVNGFNSWSLRIYFFSILSKDEVYVYASLLLTTFFSLNFLRNSIVDFKLRNEMKRSHYDLSNATKNHFCEFKCCSSGESQ